MQLRSLPVFANLLLFNFPDMVLFSDLVAPSLSDFRRPYPLEDLGCPTCCKFILTYSPFPPNLDIYSKTRLHSMKDGK